MQNDIKRVLAYSTVSQLGFMFMALGVGAYWVAIFHLVTHAFFKALLFLGAGSVIHGVRGEQDMRRMGGLRKHMPVTHATMLAGSLAIAGIPGLAGFFSKEQILASAFVSARGVYYVGIVTALMTAYYMWRLMRMTFYGEERFDSHAVHPHESPLTMTAPLVLLAAGSVVAGWPHKAFEHYLGSVFPPAETHRLDAATGYLLMAAAIAAALLGIFLARFQVRGPVHKVLHNKWYVDEFYAAVFVNGIAKGGGRLLASFDRSVVDGAVNGTAWTARLASKGSIFWDTWVVDGLVRLSSFAIWLLGYPTRLLQTGRVQTYALFVVLGLLAMFGMFVTR